MNAPKEYPTPSRTLPCTIIGNILSKSEPMIIEWSEVHTLIRHDLGLKSNTEKARHLLAEGNEAGYSRQKSQVGAIIPAVQCSGGRKAENIVALTGVSMVDLDHVPADRLPAIEDIIRHDPHTFLYHRTTSGLGCRIFFRYSSPNPSIAYLRAWQWGNQYYSMITGFDHDPATKDPNRLSFLTHDPDAFFNPQATPFSIQQVQRDTQPLPASTDDRIRAAEDLLARQGIVYSEGQRHNFLLQKLILLVKHGIPQHDALLNITPLCPRGPREAQDLVQWVYDHFADHLGEWEKPLRSSAPRRRNKASDDASDDDGRSRSSYASVEEIRAFLLENNTIRHNSITACLELLGPDQQFAELDDRTANTLWHECIVALGKYVRATDFDKELHSEAIPAHDPFAHFFHSLPQWDGQDHIAHLASRVHVQPSPRPLADNPLSHTLCSTSRIFEFCFRKWFVSMVASWLHPKVLNQTILTFIGGQGIYKSTFFRRLLPPELERYFLAKGNATYVSKDDKIAVSSYGLIDFEEIDSMKDADLNAVKALVTTEVIAERAAYARNRENRPHLASFCATGNNMHFLTDLTGNRRWLPFLVQSIDSPYDHPIPYPQLYAQALHLINHGFQYWFSRDEDLALEAHKQSFAEPCLEEELVLKYFRKPEFLETGQFYTTTDIVARCSADLRGQLQTKRMGQVLQRLGFKQRKSNAKRGYILVERTFEEIQMKRIEDARLSKEEERQRAQGTQTQLPQED